MPGRGSCRACAAWFIQLHLRGGSCMCPESVLTHMRQPSLPEGGVEPPAWGKPQPGLRHNLVDARKEQGRCSQAECACGPHVDDKLELGRLLNGQLGRTCALHDPPYIDASCASAR